ncbi:MAG: hypothetical protein ABIJ17_02405 [Patescibacteria group bacterium]
MNEFREEIIIVIVLLFFLITITVVFYKLDVKNKAEQPNPKIQIIDRNTFEISEVYPENKQFKSCINSLILNEETLKIFFEEYKKSNLSKEAIIVFDISKYENFNSDPNRNLIHIQLTKLGNETGVKIKYINTHIF